LEEREKELQQITAQYHTVQKDLESSKDEIQKLSSQLDLASNSSLGSSKQVEELMKTLQSTTQVELLTLSIDFGLPLILKELGGIKVQLNASEGLLEVKSKELDRLQHQKEQLESQVGQIQ
jgi:chromosome segregation ATPase